MRNSISRRDFIKTTALALPLIVTGCAGTATGTAGRQNAGGDFVTIRNRRFELRGRPYFYVGTNFWCCCYLSDSGLPGGRERMVRELDNLQSIGVKNIRLLAGSESSPLAGSIPRGITRAPRPRWTGRPAWRISASSDSASSAGGVHHVRGRQVMVGRAFVANGAVGDHGAGNRQCGTDTPGRSESDDHLRAANGHLLGDQHGVGAADRATDDAARIARRFARSTSRCGNTAMRRTAPPRHGGSARRSGRHRTPGRRPRGSSPGPCHAGSARPRPARRARTVASSSAWSSKGRTGSAG